MQSSIRLSSERDINDLCAVWQSCFNDSEEYIRYFYKENFGRIAVPVVTVNDRPVSMIHLMDAAFADGTDEYPVRFIYAAGTLPSFRGKGFMKKLLEHVQKDAKKNGCGLFLKPSSYLADYYTALGFSVDTRFRIFESPYNSEERCDISFDLLSAEEYNMLRNSSFSGRSYVKWPDAHVRWCIDENVFCGGKTLSFTLDGIKHFVMGCPAGDVLNITETDLSPDELPEAGPALCRLFGTSRLAAFLPEESMAGSGKTVISSVVFNTPLRRSYANLMLF